MSKAKKITTGGLRWLGSAFLPGVPARDLTADEVETYGGYDYLIKSGIYVPAEDGIE